MSTTTLAIIFGVILFVALIFLIIWSVTVSKNNMTKQRHQKMAASRQKQKDSIEDDLSDSKGYWFNKDDMEGVDEIMQLHYQHHFYDIESCVNDLIVEMYDCGLVKTEELYTIAYGRDALTPDALVFKTSGLTTDDDDDNNAKGNETKTEADTDDISLPPVSDEAQRKIYEKWNGYVAELLNKVEIKASEDDKNAIIDELMTYGRKNLSTLLYSPE